LSSQTHQNPSDTLIQTIQAPQGRFLKVELYGVNHLAFSSFKAFVGTNIDDTTATSLPMKVAAVSSEYYAANASSALRKKLSVQVEPWMFGHGAAGLLDSDDSTCWFSEAVYASEDVLGGWEWIIFDFGSKQNITRIEIDTSNTCCTRTAGQCANKTGLDLGRTLSRIRVSLSKSGLSFVEPTRTANDIGDAEAYFSSLSSTADEGDDDVDTMSHSGLELGCGTCQQCLWESQVTCGTTFQSICASQLASNQWMKNDREEANSFITLSLATDVICTGDNEIQLAIESKGQITTCKGHLMFCADDSMLLAEGIPAGSFRNHCCQSCSGSAAEFKSPCVPPHGFTSDSTMFDMCPELCTNPDTNTLERLNFEANHTSHYDPSKEECPVRDDSKCRDSQQRCMKLTELDEMKCTKGFKPIQTSATGAFTCCIDYGNIAAAYENEHSSHWKDIVSEVTLGGKPTKEIFFTSTSGRDVRNYPWVESHRSACEKTGWCTGFPGDSCAETCGAVGRVCSAREMWKRNSFFDTTSETLELISTVGGSTFKTNCDVPLSDYNDNTFSPAAPYFSRDACSVSPFQRALDKFDCGYGLPQVSRICYCSTPECAKEEDPNCPVAGPKETTQWCGDGPVTQPGLPCLLPFKYNGVEYDACTKVDSIDGKAWCPTALSSTGEYIGSWSHCVDCLQEGVSSFASLDTTDGLVGCYKNCSATPGCELFLYNERDEACHIAPTNEHSLASQCAHILDYSTTNTDQQMLWEFQVASMKEAKMYMVNEVSWRMFGRPEVEEQCSCIEGYEGDPFDHTKCTPLSDNTPLADNCVQVTVLEGAASDVDHTIVDVSNPRMMERCVLHFDCDHSWDFEYFAMDLVSSRIVNGSCNVKYNADQLAKCTAVLYPARQVDKKCKYEGTGFPPVIAKVRLETNDAYQCATHYLAQLEAEELDATTVAPTTAQPTGAPTVAPTTAQPTGTPTQLIAGSLQATEIANAHCSLCSTASCYRIEAEAMLNNTESRLLTTATGAVSQLSAGAFGAGDTIAETISACIFCEEGDSTDPDSCIFVEPEAKAADWAVCDSICEFVTCASIQDIIMSHFLTHMDISVEKLPMYVHRFLYPLCYACLAEGLSGGEYKCTREEYAKLVESTHASTSGGLDGSPCVDVGIDPNVLETGLIKETTCEAAAVAGRCTEFPMEAELFCAKTCNLCSVVVSVNKIPDTTERAAAKLRAVKQIRGAGKDRGGVGAGASAGNRNRGSSKGELLAGLGALVAVAVAVVSAMGFLMDRRRQVMGQIMSNSTESSSSSGGSSSSGSSSSFEGGRGFRSWVQRALPSSPSATMRTPAATSPFEVSDADSAEDASSMRRYDSGDYCPERRREEDAGNSTSAGAHVHVHIARDKTQGGAGGLLLELAGVQGLV
jgi:hypothetical protein